MRIQTGVLLLTSILVPAFVSSTSAWGYLRLNTGDPGVPADLARADAAGIQFYLNSSVVPGASSGVSGKNVRVITADSDPISAMKAALASWRGVNTANINLLPLLSTTAGIDVNDFKNVVAIAQDPGDVSAVSSALALTRNLFTLGTGRSGPYDVTPGSIIDSDIILNPSFAFSTNGTTTVDLQSVLTHELGHSLGANHTGVLGATMFQAAALSQRGLTLDDITFVNVAYPKTTGGAVLGKISGTITVTGGGAAAFPLLTFFETGSGAVLGGLGGIDGTYSLQVPPGSYLVYAEPFGIVQAGNLYFTQAQANAATKFQAAMLGGVATPTPVLVTAGTTATASIAVNAGSTTLQLQYAAFGAAGGAGDIHSFPSIAGPVLVASGKPVDLVFFGAGLDATLTDANFKVFGQGISVVAGSVRADPRSLPVAGLTVMRVTLNIAARTTQGLASIFITKGANTLALSGVMVMGTPAPAFPLGGVVNGASFGSAGAVAPGEIVTIFGSNVGPANLITADISLLGVFSKNTGDTRVLFDGVPASMIYSFGPQTTVAVPYSVAGQQNTSIVVEYQGLASAPISVPVRVAAPGLFLGLAAGQAVAFNGDNKTINSAATPEVRGTGVVVLFLTGEGQTNPGGTDGLIASTVFPKPVAAVAVSIGGQTLNAGQIKYYGAAPFLLAGVMQLNVEIPANIPAGPAAVVVTIGGVASPPTNIFVK